MVEHIPSMLCLTDLLHHVGVYKFGFLTEAYSFSKKTACSTKQVKIF